MEAKLVVVGGDIKASEINLKLPAIIGRGREAAITLGHALVSRQHCELFEDDGRLMVKDLGSLNGTFVDNERISECELPPGHLLTVGTVTFRAVYGDGPAPIMPPKKARTDTEIPDGTVFTPKSARGAAADALDTEMVEEILDFESFEEEQLAETEPAPDAPGGMPMFLDVGEPMQVPASASPAHNISPEGDAEEVEEILELGDLADFGFDDEPEAPSAPTAPATPAPQASAAPAAPAQEPAAAEPNEPFGDVEPMDDVVEELGDVEVIDELDVVEMLEEPEEPAAPVPAPAAAAPVPTKPAAPKPASAAPAAKTAPAEKPAGAPAKSTAAPKATPKAPAPAAGGAETAAAAGPPDQDLDDFFRSLQ